MCTIALLVDLVDQNSRSMSLVIAANRDEMYARPTRPPEVLEHGVVG
ncbi:MAG: NRDE family protein, partial [Deltaproteobacteria bacterium]|nr:NRDE family protein [Deltaproteobacteria bacterium]